MGSYSSQRSVHCSVGSAISTNIWHRCFIFRHSDDISVRTSLKLCMRWSVSFWLSGVSSKRAMFMPAWSIYTMWSLLSAFWPIVTINSVLRSFGTGNPSEFSAVGLSWSPYSEIFLGFIWLTDRWRLLLLFFSFYGWTLLSAFWSKFILSYSYFWICVVGLQGLHMNYESCSGFFIGIFPW